jgi:integrase
MAKRWIEGNEGKWEGGRVALDRNDEKVWVLERMVEGERYTITLQASSLKEARVQLATFQSDPVAYVAKLKARTIVLDDAEIGTFLKHKETVGQSCQHRVAAERYLKRWRDFFDGRDLRKYKAADLLDWMDGRPPYKETRSGRKHLILHLRAWATYRREVRQDLPVEADPTRTLKLPKVKAARRVKPKDYSIQHAERLYAGLSNHESARGYRPPEECDAQPLRDLLLLHAKCGLHYTEIERLAKGEAGSRIDVVEGKGEIAAVLQIAHKGGEHHPQSIDLQTLAAARRLVARGSPPSITHFTRKLKEVCRELGLPVMTPGRFRHAFVSWLAQCGKQVHPAGDGGLPLNVIADTVGHKSALTTDAYYRHVAIPPMAVVPIRLHHPQDPIPLQPGSAVRSA